MITAVIHEAGDTRAQSCRSMAAFQMIFTQSVVSVRTDPSTIPFRAPDSYRRHVERLVCV
jgi:hypothetical protein